MAGAPIQGQLVYFGKIAQGESRYPLSFRYESDPTDNLQPQLNISEKKLFEFLEFPRFIYLESTLKSLVNILPGIVREDILMRILECGIW
jgi:hypothetical protein